MIEKILQNRTSLMRFSIIWIFINHLSFFGYLGNSTIINSFIEIGSCGVDIFMLLSSMGLYLSLQKNYNIRYFYKKRLNRILPCFILLYPLWVLTTKNINPYPYLKSMWFILAILIFYLFYPFCYKKLSNYKGNRLCIPFVITILITLFFTLILYFKGGYYAYMYGTWMNMVQRIPIFITGTLLIIGAIFPRLIYKSHIIFLLSLCAAYVIHYNFNEIYYKHFLFVSYYFLSISIIKYLIYLFEHSKKLNEFLKFIGKYTLEIYLVHMLLMPFMKFLIPIYPNIYLILLILFLTIVIVYFTNRILNIYYNKIKL